MSRDCPVGPAKAVRPGSPAVGFSTFDDLGAEPGERLGAGRARLELREIEHPDPGEALQRGAIFLHRYRNLQSRREIAR